MTLRAKETDVPDDEPATTGAQSIDETLLGILVCPTDHGPLRAETADLVCTVCGRRYPVEDGIPNMLTDPA